MPRLSFKSILVFVILFLVILSSGCNFDNNNINHPPEAYAGDDQYVVTGSTVYLTGGYYDQDNDSARGRWEIIQKPAGSTAVLSSDTSPSPYFVADRDGVYVIKLIVNDGKSNSAPDYVNVYASPDGDDGGGGGGSLIAKAGEDQVVIPGTLVTLDGSQSSGGSGSSLTYQWSFVTKPTSSGVALSSETSVSPSFTPDLMGTYLLSLVVSDGTEYSAPALVKVTVCKSFHNLTFRIIDAEYSKGRDKIIAIRSGPNALIIYDPATNSQASVSLPLVPTCVSVSPDGQYAAVGFDAYISYINLSTATLVKTIAVTCNVFDIVLAGNGYAYAFPLVDQWVKIHCINIGTGVETTSSGYSIRDCTRAKLHPSGKYIYGADNGVSPADIEKYNIVPGTAAYLYDSPYHGTYPMGGNLWISEDGQRIFTRCGYVFRATESQTDDMTYNGSLGKNIVSMDHSTEQNAIGVVHDESPNQVNLYSYDFLAPQTVLGLPTVVNNQTSYACNGKYVFYNNDGSDLYVILQADEDSGLLNDYYVVAYDGTPSAGAQGQLIRTRSIKRW